MIIAESGERKSAADDIALRSISEYEETLVEDYEIQVEKYKQELEDWKDMRRPHLRKPVKVRAKRFGQIGPEPNKPLQPYLTTSSPTWEGLYDSLKNGRAVQGILSDEGGLFFGGHGMNPDNQLKMITGLCKLYDKGEADKFRRGDGASKFSKRRVNFCQLMQPVVADGVLDSRLMQEQGFLARNLIASPAPTKKTYQQTDLSKDKYIQRYWAQCTELLERELPLCEGGRSGVSPRPLWLSKQAKQIYIAFHDEIQGKLAPGKRYHSIKPFAAKAHDHALRVAATLAFFHDPDCQRIGSDWILKAIKIVRHSLSEHLRLVDKGGPSQNLRDGNALLQWLNHKKRGGRPISLAEICKTGPRSIRSAGKARALIKVLKTHAQLRDVPRGCEYSGTHCKEAYELT